MIDYMGFLCCLQEDYCLSLFCVFCDSMICASYSKIKEHFLIVCKKSIRVLDDLDLMLSNDEKFIEYKTFLLNATSNEISDKQLISKSIKNKIPIKQKNDLFTSFNFMQNTSNIISANAYLQDDYTFFWSGGS